MPNVINTFLYGGYRFPNAYTSAGITSEDKKRGAIPKLINIDNYWGAQGMGYSRHEDPLMLGFTIEFDFVSSPLFLYTREMHRMTPRECCMFLNDVATYNDASRTYSVNELSDIKWSQYAEAAQYYDINFLDSGNMCSAAEYIYLNTHGPQPIQQTSNWDGISDVDPDIIIEAKANEIDARIRDYKIKYELETGVTLETQQPIPTMPNESVAGLKANLQEIKNNPSGDKITDMQRRVVAGMQAANEISNSVNFLADQAKELRDMIKGKKTNPPKPDPGPLAKDDFEIDPSLWNLINANKMMFEISNNHPYMFQSISGVDELIKNYYNNEKGSFGSGEDAVITINCLESVDFKIAKMLHMYKDSIWDSNYMRSRIPDNLRKFNCRILIHDLRSFDNYLTMTGHILDKMHKKLHDSRYTQGSTHSLSSMFAAAEHMGCFEIVLLGCEFTPDMGSGLFSDPHYDTADPINNSFSFKWDKELVDFVDFSELVDMLDSRLDAEYYKPDPPEPPKNKINLPINSVGVQGLLGKVNKLF